MIILSQDKTEIINFDNVNTLQVTKEGLIVSYENTYKAEDYCSNTLGQYKTEERAKEVLQEILNFRTNKLVMTTEGITSEIKDYFEMPEE